MSDFEQDLGVNGQTRDLNSPERVDMNQLPKPLSTQIEFSAKFSKYESPNFYSTNFYAAPTETGQAEVVSEVRDVTEPGAIVAIGLSGLLLRDSAECKLLLD